MIGQLQYTPEVLRQDGNLVIFCKIFNLSYPIYHLDSAEVASLFQNHADQDGRARDDEKQSGEPAHPTAPRHGLFQ
jgi:hypothetical protein